ncbi:hypothetical protein KQX54_011856 [Cotesia glomerata]|uniref:Uncharacterized protein n=1 Tax=Cotesia glomerata TaxID=32391 RepID=A0AAV7ID38_COTGL|nr:hypothetical protein KQX54_011856 [Cotesia glomerata]
MYKKKTKVDPVAIDSEDGSESIVSEMLERTESSLSHMTLSQSSSDDPSFRVNITPTDNCTEYIEIPMKRTIQLIDIVVSAILRPAEILSKLFDTDNVSPVIEEDSGED